MLFNAPAVAYEPGLGGGPGWPLTLASSPGAYLGAAVLLGAWLAFSGRWRSLAWPFVVTGVVVYLASLAVIADAIPDALGRSLIVGLYLHAPYWIGYELVLVLPVLGAIGLASWPEAGSNARRIAVGCSAAVLVILPLLLGVGARTPVVVAVGVAAVVGILWLASSRPKAVWALPFVLVLELGLAQIVSVPDTATKALGPIPVNISPLNHFPLTRPVVLNVSPFQRPLSRPGSGRFILTDTSRARRDARTARHRRRGDRARLAAELGAGLGSTQRAGISRCCVAALLEVRAGDGQHALQLRAHPVCRRAADARQSAAGRLGAAPCPGHTRRRRDPRSAHPPLCALPPGAVAAAGVAVQQRGRRSDSSAAALARVRNPGFDPTRDAVDRRRVGVAVAASSHRPARPDYIPGAPGSATVVVDATDPALVLIRTPYAQGWQATIDGHSAAVVPADYVDQGVLVPRGRHVIRLTFTDPWVMRGVWGTLVGDRCSAGGRGHFPGPRPSPAPS